MLGRTLTEIKEQHEKVMNELHLLEDMTNYDIKPLGECIDIMQELDIDKEWENYHKEGKQ